MAGFASLCIAFLVMVVSSLITPANAAVEELVDALRKQTQNSSPDVTFPPGLARRASPLKAAAVAQFATDLEEGSTATKISSFCREAGMLCEEKTVVYQVNLHEFVAAYFCQPMCENFDQNLFFGETKLVPGNWISLMKEENLMPERAFLPRVLAAKLPFTRARLPELLRTFNFSDQSNMARNMAETLEVCEAEPMEGEVKACVTSMEAMADFLVSILGSGRGIEEATARDSEKLFTKERRGEMARVMDVREIGKRSGGGGGGRSVVGCHNAMFPYEVFYCHRLRDTKVFLVHVETQGAEEGHGVVTCHPVPNSSLPGLMPRELVCHWNSPNNLVWIPSPF